MKKILCISDQIDPLVYDKKITERFKEADFILSAGDLPMEYLDFIQSALKKPLFFVFGAHYLKALTYYHPEMAEKTQDGTVNVYKKNNQFKSAAGKYLGFKAVYHEGLLIAGISGAKKRNDGKNRFSEAQMKRRLFKLGFTLLLNKLRYGRFVDILITHAPPALSTEDLNETCGFKCFVPFIKFFKPRFLVHGHLHIHGTEKNRLCTFEKTEIINAYSSYMLEID